MELRHIQGGVLNDTMDRPGQAVLRWILSIGVFCVGRGPDKMKELAGTWGKRIARTDGVENWNIVPVHLIKDVWIVCSFVWGGVWRDGRTCRDNRITRTDGTGWNSEY